MKKDSPTVFISYAWSTVEHEKWIIELATRLFHSGVIVKLDKWDLSPGQDKYSFMEKMVQDQSIKYVLMICDKKYQEKADERKGGVGTETLIISNEVYKSVDQNKFIPIIKEYDKNGDPCLPTYLSSRIYLDFSDNHNYEESFDALLRNIFEQPEIKRPELGVPPQYLFETDIQQDKSYNTYKQLLHSLKSEKPYSISLLSQFIDEIFEILENHSVKFQSEIIDEEIIKSIKNLNLYRDHIVDVLFQLFTYKSDFDFDIIINLFEKLNYFFKVRKEGESYTKYSFDNFKYFSLELFLIVISLLIKKHQYNHVSSLIHGPFFPRSFFNTDENKPNNCTFLNHYIDSFERFRKERLKLNYYSVTGEFMKENCPSNINFQDIVLAEIIVFNATLLNHKKVRLGRDWWYPRIHYYVDYSMDTTFFKKIIIKKHFDKIKSIFLVSTPSELIDKINNINQKINSGEISYNYEVSLPLMQRYFDVRQLADL